MLNFFKKLVFLFKKPCIILITGRGCSCAAAAVCKILEPHFKVRKVSDNVFPLIKNKKEILIWETKLIESENREQFRLFKFLLRKSKRSILVVTHIGEIPPDKLFFTGERKETLQIRELAKTLPARSFLVLNFDDETIREIKNETISHSLTYGFQERTDFQASDVNINLEGTNFKINYERNIIPFWLKNLFGKEQIYSALIAICVGVINDINLIEISQALKTYQSLPGKMRLVKGIKNSFIIDDSNNATSFSMLEGLEILRKVETEGKKIAVLGDVLGIGKYTIEAHETIGEKAAKICDLLFTFGQRARFIAQGAINKGMEQEKIFQFDTIKQGKILLQDRIKQGDLILIDGSKEMKMQEIVEEIKAMNNK